MPRKGDGNAFVLSLESWPPVWPTIFSVRVAGIPLPVIGAAGSVADAAAAPRAGKSGAARVAAHPAGANETATRSAVQYGTAFMDQLSWFGMERESMSCQNTISFRAPVAV